jgi:hypothetical protein
MDRQSGGSVKTSATQMEGIPQEELCKKKMALECMRHAWLADWKGNRKTMDYDRLAKSDLGTVNFPKANEYQKLRVGAYELEEHQKDLYTEGYNSKELRDTTSDELSEGPSESSESKESEEPSDRMAYWW